MNFRVLLTCAGGTMVPDLLNHLRSDQIIRPYLVGVDVSASAPGRSYVDAFYEVPWGEDPSYVDKIAKIVAFENLNLVIPGSDQEAFSLASGRAKIQAAGAALLASPVSVLNLIRDKQETYRTLQSAGLRVPEYHCVANVKDLHYAMAEFGYPKRSVIVKPVAGRGGRGMRLLIGSGEVPAAWIGAGAREKRIPQPPSVDETVKWFEDGALMVMPLLTAPVYDVDVFAIKGKARAALVRMRFNPTGIPFQGNRIVSDPLIMAYCLEIAEILGLDALHDIDLMTDHMGRPCVLEVNPRPSGSVVAAHEAGFPIVASAIAETLGVTYPLQMPTRDVDVGVVPRATKMFQSAP